MRANEKQEKSAMQYVNIYSLYIYIYNNNNKNHLFYIALLKSPEVALQSRVQESNTVIPVVVELHQEPQLPWGLPQSAPTAPPPISTYGPSTNQRLRPLPNQRGDQEETKRRPRGDQEENTRRTRGEHEETTRRPRGEQEENTRRTRSPQKGPGTTGIRTQSLLAVRRQG